MVSDHGNATINWSVDEVGVVSSSNLFEEVVHDVIAYFKILHLIKIMLIINNKKTNYILIGITHTFWIL